jgi:tetratricopeptide (TPR) repeat protein
MTRVNKYKQDFVLFLELGFVAINQGDEKSCRALFDAAQLLDPANSLPKVGVGYLHLQKLELTKAMNCFEKVIKEEPENEMAKTFLGICMSMAPNKEDKGEKILKETLKSDDPLIKKLSTDSLDFVEKFVKKEPPPAAVRKTK